MANPIPLKFSTFLQTRDGTSTSKDARITNLIVEPISEDETHFLKRPGYSIFDGTGWASQSALGATTLPDGTIISFIGNPYGGTNNATMHISLPYNPYTIFDINRTGAHILLGANRLSMVGDNSSSSAGTSLATVFKSSGLYYYEAYCKAGSDRFCIGIATTADAWAGGNDLATTGGDVAVGYMSNGSIYVNGSNIASVATYAAGDTISILWDGANVIAWKNGTTVGTISTTAVGSYTPGASVILNTANAITCNFGNSPWHYAPPAGYVGWKP